MYFAAAWCELSATIRASFGYHQLYGMFLLAPWRASVRTISWPCFTDVTLDCKYRPEGGAFATLDLSVYEKM